MAGGQFIHIHVESITQHSFSSSAHASCARDKHLLAYDTPRQIIHCHSLALLPIYLLI